MEEIRKQTPPPLPPKRKMVVKKELSIDNIVDFVNVNTDGLIHCSSMYINDFAFFKDNLDLIHYKLNKLGKDYVRFTSYDYDVLKYTHDNFPQENMKLSLSLIDDNELKDRTYIDVSEFDKAELLLPMSYVLWGNELTKDQKITYIRYLNDPAHSNQFNTLHVEELKKIKEIIGKLGEECKDLDDLEKLIVLSNYIQNRTQFVEENNRSHNGCVYITDSKGVEVTREKVGSAENVILNKFGLCCGIATAMEMLGNNKDVKLNIHTTRGNEHVWNYVKLGNNWYHSDTTWCITNNPNRYPESLKAREFSDEYLVFGDRRAKCIGYHDSTTITPDITDGLIYETYHNSIENRVKKLSKDFNFTDYEEPVFESRIER